MAARRDKQVATYLNEELYEFFVGSIMPRYGQGLSASDTIKLLLIQEQRRITNNNTKEHDLEVIKGDTASLKTDVAEVKDDVALLQAEVAELKDRIRRMEAQNELLLMGVMGVIVMHKGQPITLDVEKVQEIRSLVDQTIFLGEQRVNGRGRETAGE